MFDFQYLSQIDIKFNILGENSKLSLEFNFEQGLMDKNGKMYVTNERVWTVYQKLHRVHNQSNTCQNKLMSAITQNRLVLLVTLLHLL